MKFYQCTKCGRVTQAKKSLPLIDELYAEVKCVHCGNNLSLYICDNPDDFYLYYDVTLDERYQNY